MIYLTFNDPYTGVYQSQVIDVVHHLTEIGNKPITLVAFVPLKIYGSNRSLINKYFHGKAVVLPVFSVRFWKWHSLFLKSILAILHPKGIICRGPLACSLAIKSKFKGMKVCFDGRGATKAEVQEYDMNLSPKLIAEFIEAERQSVNHSDFRLAVSEALVDYWREHYSYLGDKYVVIPCAVSNNIRKDEFRLTREMLGFNHSQTLLVYSGGTQGWQGFDLFLSWIERGLVVNENWAIMLLTQAHPKIDDLIRKFGEDRIKRFWLSPNEVNSYLSVADFGILIRPYNETNKVASPTKFAEYLIAGLPVLLSSGIGDYSKLVKDKNLGFEIRLDQNDDLIEFPKFRIEEKERIFDFARNYLAKDSPIIRKRYRTLLRNLMNMSV